MTPTKQDYGRQQAEKMSESEQINKMQNELEAARSEIVALKEQLQKGIAQAVHMATQNMQLTLQDMEMRQSTAVADLQARVKEVEVGEGKGIDIPERAADIGKQLWGMGGGGSMPDGEYQGDLLYWNTGTSSWWLVRAPQDGAVTGVFVLVYDSTLDGGVKHPKWLQLDVKYEGVFHGASGKAVSDWPRFHS